MNIARKLEQFNRLMENIYPDECEGVQMKLDICTTEEQLAQLQAHSHLGIPEELKDFYRQQGGIMPCHRLSELYLYVPGITKLLYDLNEKSDVNIKWPMLTQKSLGLVDSIRHSWGNDRPEFDEGRFFNAEDLHFLNEHYMCFGLYRFNLEGAWYLFFDKHGRFGKIWYEQDDFGELKKRLRSMLIDSPADQSLNSLLVHSLKQVALIAVDYAENPAPVSDLEDFFGDTPQDIDGK